MTVQGITTYLWFDHEALEAATFYVGLFPDSRLGTITYYQAGAPLPEGTVLTVEFELFGRPFAGLNGGPIFPHSEAVSFQVVCDTQEELDHLWYSLIADGGAESQCGWCKDRWGVSWQIVPKYLADLHTNGAPGAEKAFAAMMQMGKLDIAALQAAAAS